MAKMAVKSIRFFYLDQSFFFPERNKLKLFLIQLINAEGYRVDKLTYNFCSDGYLAQLNEHHLNHKTLTDVITFQYSAGKQPLVAEIFISIDRVRENALLYKCSFLMELYRVMFHGGLHLCGYGDKTKKETKMMRWKEKFYLEKYVPRETDIHDRI
jgi:probable rRNA maturation factor